MKNIIFVQACIVIIALAFLIVSGCGDDSKSSDKSEDNKLVGKYCPNNDCSQVYIEINEDGTFVESELTRRNEDDKGTYEVKGDELRLIQGDQSETWEISGTDLIDLKASDDFKRWEKQ